MNRSGYIKFILTVLTAAVVILGVTAINAIDRLRQSNIMLADKITAVMASSQTAMSPVAAPPLPSEAKTKMGGETIANREFFDPAATPGGRIIHASMADSQNMNPLITNDAAVAEFQSLCNSSLAVRNYADINRYQGLLAESWSVSEDKLEFRIKLRPGVLWHDFTDPVNGKKWSRVPVTAHDFKFLIDVIRDPDVNCAPYRVYYNDLDSLTVLNDLEFKVRWKRPYYGALTATLNMSPLPRHLYHAYSGPFDGKKFNDDHLRNRLIVGCGPYKFLKWEKDVRIIFTRFENYFGAQYGIAPPIKDVVFELIKHPNTRFQALVAGSVDQLNLTPEQWVKRTGDGKFTSAGLKKFSYPAMAYTYIGYNLRNPLFSDRRVRQALTMLIDRRKILHDVLFDLGVIINSPFFPESAYYDRRIKPYDYDPAAARRLLAAAGWRDSDNDGILDRDGKKFTFTILQVNGSTAQQKILPMIKESLAQCGIDMKIQPLDWSVCLQRINNRNFDSCMMAWTMPPDPDPYQVWHSSQADRPESSNHIGYKNPELDKLIEELRRTFDEAERIKLCHRMAAIFHEDQPYTFMYTPFNLLAIAARYRNVKKFPLGIPDEIIWTPKALQRQVPGL